MARGGGEQWTICQSERESPTLAPGRAGQGKEPLVNVGMRKVRDPRNSTAAEKVKVFRIGLESEVAAKDPLVHPFKNSHQNHLDRLAKRPLTPALVKFEQRGVLVNDS